MSNSNNQPCGKCGRRLNYKDGSPCPCPCQPGIAEYGKKVAGCIRNKNPECPLNAVIPSVVVDSIDGISKLRDAFVHVSNINTTFYVDDKGRMMITWAGPVTYPDYDYRENPLNLRSQFLYTTEGSARLLFFFDKQGQYNLIDIDNIEIDNKLSLSSKNAVQNRVITRELYRKQDLLIAGQNITIVEDPYTQTAVISAKGGSGGSPELQADLTTSIDVGGIAAGTTYPAGTPLEQLWRDLLSPTLFPTLTNPSATLVGSGSKLLETGSTLAATMTINFNRGSIDPSFGTSGFRSGPAISYQLNVAGAQAGNTFNVTVSESNNLFSGSVTYAEGEQPKDSVGNDYDSPLPAGVVSTNPVSYEFVDALWGTTVSSNTVSKQPLVSKSAKEYVFKMTAQTPGEPNIFDIPASWAVTAVQAYNNITKEWQNVNEFATTDTTHENAGGATVNYKRYTDNRGYAADGRDIKVKWS